MEKITLEALLRIRDLAACAVRHPDICAAAELALLELNWRSMMVFSLLFDMQSETYVPFVLSPSTTLRRQGHVSGARRTASLRFRRSL